LGSGRIIRARAFGGGFSPGFSLGGFSNLRIGTPEGFSAGYRWSCEDFPPRRILENDTAALYALFVRFFAFGFVASGLTCTRL
jgi:hypothetical protein